MGREGPVIAENLGEVSDGRPLQHKGQIAPAFRGGLRPEVIRGQVPPAGEHARVVEHGDLAMVAQVAAADQGDAPHRQEERGRSARPAQFPQRPQRHAERAQPVQQQPHLDALFRLRRQMLHDDLAGVVVHHLVCLDADAVLGAVDQVDQIGERLLAIRVEMDAVAGRWRREAIASQQTFANGRPAVRGAWRFGLKLDLGFGG